jgi:hypothetical protein
MDPNDVAAGTSPATETPAPSFQSLTPSARKTFLETGDLDLEKAFTPQKAEPIPDAEAVPKGGKPSDESGAAPDAAKKDTTQEPAGESRHDRRARKLANELRDAKAEIERLKGANPGQETQKPMTNADSGPKKPRLSDYPGTNEGIGEWEEAMYAFIQSGFKSEMKSALAAEHEAERMETERMRTEKQTESVAETFIERAAKFRKQLKLDDFPDHFSEVRDFCEKTKRWDLSDAILDSPTGPEMTYYFGEHFEELEALAKMSPNAALREIGRLEVSGKIKTPVSKKHTDATRLAPEISGTGSADNEEAQLIAAAERGDMKTYNKIMDRIERREMAEIRR